VRFPRGKGVEKSLHDSTSERREVKTILTELGEILSDYNNENCKELLLL